MLSDEFKFFLLTDNNETIALFKNEKIIRNARHIEIRYHHIKNLMKKDSIEIFYIFSIKIVADDLIKSLENSQFDEFQKMLSLIELSADSLAKQSKKNSILNE